ncbi:MAG: hypothetical protein U1F36_00770 [Planctomycetota bacterium]
MTDMFAMFEDDAAERTAVPSDTERSGVEPSVPASPARLDDWEASIPSLMQSYPGVKIGTLFCVYKVRLDPDVDFRDIQGEARLRDIPLSGRSLHQAKVLLGIEAARPSAPRRRKSDVEEEERDEFSFRPESIPVARPTVSEVPIDTTDFEGMLRAAVAAAAEERAAGYREAIRSALALIDEALAYLPDVE